MSEQNIDNLIGNLTKELKPVKTLAHPALRVLPWLLIAAAFVGFCVFNVGIRSDFFAQLTDSSYVFEITIAAFIALGAALSSAFLSVPDMRGQKWLIPSVLTLCAVFAGWGILRGIEQGFQPPKLAMDHCMGEGMFMAVIPVTALLFLMKRGTTTHPIMMAAMNMLAAGSLGYIGLRITCSMDTIQHVTISHLLPYIVLGSVLGLLARRLYKW